MTEHECQNCGRRLGGQQLRLVEDLSQRVAPGEPFPSGECPHCGALCHPVGTSGSQELARACSPPQAEERMEAYIKQTSSGLLLTIRTEAKHAEMTLFCAKLLDVVIGSGKLDIHAGGHDGRTFYFDIRP